MRPVFECLVGGSPAGGEFTERLVKAVLRDVTGEADTLELVFDDRDGDLAPPRKGVILAPRFGYGRDLVDKGLFEVDKTTRSRSPEEGRRLTVTGRPADLRKKLKERGRESFQGKKFGEIAKAIGKRDGFEVVVDQALADIAIAYVARTDQSPLDFLNRLARRYGGVSKPAGGKLVIAKRGSSKSASGQALPTIMIVESECSEWSFEDNPRPSHGKVETSYLDKANGQRKVERAETGYEGPVHVLRHAFASKDDAKRAAEAEVEQVNRNSGNGSVTMPGWPEAQAEADAIAEGFAPDIDGPYRAGTVAHTFQVSAGGPAYNIAVELEAPEKAKGGKK